MSEVLDLADAGRVHVAKPAPSFLFRLGAALVVLSLVLMVIGPWIAPYDPNRPTFEISEPPPALTAIPGLLWKVITGAPHEPIHWFGTDTTGLDVFSRVDRRAAHRRRDRGRRESRFADPREPARSARRLRAAVDRRNA